ncbi:MAG: esterase, partial [bacterium]
MSPRAAPFPGLFLLVLSACSLSSSAPTTSATGQGPAPPVEPSATAALITIRVDAPNSTPAGDVVHIAGDFQGWNPASPAHALVHQPDGLWTIDLNLTAGQPIQFKFTHGSWTRVEKDAAGLEIPNRTLTPVAGQTYDFTVATWADLGTLTGDVETFSHAPFRGGRTVRVYLPPGYRTSTDRYPVLYLHDGQNLFDVRTSFAGEWRVDETCDL